MDVQALHDRAIAAAQKAVDDALAQHGIDHPAWTYCGFAWVVIKPARGKFVSFLKRNDIGFPGVYSGYQFSPDVNFPPNNPIWQSLDLKYLAAQAYAYELVREGISATATSRAD